MILTTRRPGSLGRDAESIYRTCEAILAAREWLKDEIETRERAAVLDDTEADVAVGLRDKAALFRAVRTVFERQLPSNPAAALAELELWRGTAHVDIRRAATNKAPTRDACMAIAVIALVAWQEEEKKLYADLALHTLQSISGSVRSMADVKKIAASGAVQRAYRDGGGFSGGGHQAMAIAVVARATGTGPQTVKRALGAWRRSQRDQTRPPG